MNHPSIQTRLALLQVVLAVSLVGGLLAVRHWQSKQVQMLFGERVAETGRTFDRLVSLRARTFALHVADYSRWDDFVALFRTHDRAWADENLDAGTREYSVDIVWALDPSGRTEYTTRHDGRPAFRTPPVDHAVLMSRLAHERFLHFFANTPDGVLEIWTAPVQPTRDLARATPPVGYYLIGRFLTPTVLSELSRQASGVASLSHSPTPPEHESGSIETGLVTVERSLRGIDGRPVARMRFVGDFPLLVTLQDDVRQLLVVIALFLSLALVVAYALVTRWVARPIEQVRLSLEAESAAPLGKLPDRRDEFGRIARLVAEFFGQRAALVREVMIRQAAESESELRARHIRAVIDADPNVVYVVDGEGRLVLANHGAEELFAAVAGEDPGPHVPDALASPGSGSADDGDADAATPGATTAASEAVELADGSRRHYRTLRRRLPGADGAGHLLTVSVDVTQHLEQERLLREARDAAEAGARAKSQFLANISHELRTPMHGILSYAKFGLRESATASPEELRGYFENVRDCGETLLELLNDLLDLAKFEAGRMQFRFARLEVPDVVESVVNEFNSLLDERGIHVSVDEVESLPAISGDRTRLLQVLRNLLSNAAKFSDVGSHIRVHGERDPMHLRILVDDEGHGVPEGELDAIFDPFVQSSANAGSAGGTGLGLAISREIVASHGGRIWAEHRPGGGTRIVIELPVPAESARDDEGGAAIARAA